MKAFPGTWFGERITADLLPSVARLSVGYLGRREDHATAVHPRPAGAHGR
ncbi:hypothetical protein [Kineosporia mesophila]|nr:hypothetical protein [Kineosporia mesophila]MCD5352403.1 hypothetical protein [Kineosporia mesophila]